MGTIVLRYVMCSNIQAYRFILSMFQEFAVKNLLRRVAEEELSAQMHCQSHHTSVCGVSAAHHRLSRDLPC